MIVLNSLFPVFFIIILGGILKRWNLTTDSFLKVSDKLVYYIFFPLMLFWKIGSSSSASNIDFSYTFVTLITVTILFLLGIIFKLLFNIHPFKMGAFSQSCYRFNTYIGVAIIINVLGEEGVQKFGILIALAIPFINILSVSVSVWYSNQEMNFLKQISITIKNIITNPLIIACVMGIIYSQLFNGFPIFLVNSFKLLSSITLPLALLSIGAAITFKSVNANLNLSIVASVLKLILFPVIGYFFLDWFNIKGIERQVSMIFFALPTSTAIYVLAAQLNSDKDLASASIVLSTILSFISLSVVLLYFI